MDRRRTLLEFGVIASSTSKRGLIAESLSQVQMLALERECDVEKLLEEMTALLAGV
jgi:hypothetical protein